MPTAKAQLPFFKRTLRFVDGTSDARLLEHVHEYREHLLAQSLPNQEGEEAPLPCFEVEVIWRAHLLSLAAYVNDCRTLLDCKSARSPIEHGHHPAGDYDDDAVLRPGGGGGTLNVSSEWATGLVAAVRQQQSFMRQILQLREAGLATTEHLTTELEAYRSFMIAAGKLDVVTVGAKHELPVPSLLVDLLWHTHMLTPGRYASQCERIAGRFIDHDAA